MSDFGISLSPTADSLVLSWSATADTLEPTAQSEAYVLYSSVDGHGWDNGVPVHDTCMAVPYRKGVTMHYKVTAVNSGGESMDSRVLAAYRAADAKGCVLIIDGFDRVAYPQGFSAGNIAGFPSWLDHGVPAATDIAFVGRQMDFDRSHPWVSDDHAGWGQSMSNFDFNPPAGNNGSHILVHGQAIAAAATRG